MLSVESLVVLSVESLVVLSVESLVVLSVESLVVLSVESLDSLESLEGSVESLEGSVESDDTESKLSSVLVEELMPSQFLLPSRAPSSDVLHFHAGSYLIPIRIRRSAVSTQSHFGRAADCGHGALNE